MIRKAVEEGLEKVRTEFRSREHQTVNKIPETVDAGNENEPDWLIGRPWGVKDRHAVLTSQTTPTSSSVPMTSADPSTSAAHAASSSRNAQQTGELNRTPSMYDKEDTGIRKVVVDKPPSLPSGTQKAIEGLMEAYLKKIGIQQESPKETEVSQTVAGSTARNIYNSGPETTQFSFQQL